MRTVQGAGALRRWHTVLQFYGHLLPRYPSFDAVPVARVPSPPLLPEGVAFKGARLWRCAHAYRGAVTEWFGACQHRKPEWCAKRFCPGQTEFPKRTADLLERAADALLGLRIAPLAWCGFSCVVWTRYARGRRGAPPLGWVYSAKRLRERVDWFAWCEQMFRGGRLLHEPGHSELVIRYERMRYALLTAPALNEGEVRRIVDMHLSERQYSKIVRQLEDGAEEAERAMRARLKDSWWIW